MKLQRPDIASQLALRIQYQSLLAQGLPLPSLFETGFRASSQTDEDGILLFLFSILASGSKIFVEIGCENAVECNCANLALEFGWHGLFVDADASAIAEAEKSYSKHPSTFAFPPKFSATKVMRDSVNSIISNAGISGEIDLLSIDVDGMDYWIWQAIEVVSPRVVVIEANGKFGDRSISVPYDAGWTYDSKNTPHYHGASLRALAKLGKDKGYRLVGANRFGFNAFFLREGEEELIPTVSVEACRRHPTRKYDEEVFAMISHLPFVDI